jgi:hypothetical protein
MASRSATRSLPLNRHLDQPLLTAPVSSPCWLSAPTWPLTRFVRGTRRLCCNLFASAFRRRQLAPIHRSPCRPCRLAPMARSTASSPTIGRAVASSGRRPGRKSGSKVVVVDGRRRVLEPSEVSPSMPSHAQQQPSDASRPASSSALHSRTTAASPASSSRSRKMTAMSASSPTSRRPRSMRWSLSPTTTTTTTTCS